MNDSTHKLSWDELCYIRYALHELANHRQEQSHDTRRSLEFCQAVAEEAATLRALAVRLVTERDSQMKSGKA